MKKSEQSAITRDRIIHSAAACFAEKGYSACSMRDIAQRAGMSKGAVYGHFSGKEELFRIMIAGEHGRGAVRAREAAAHAPYIDSIIKFMADCIRDWGFPIDHRLWIEMLAVASRDPEMKSAFMESERMARGFFMLLIQKGIDSGEIDETVDAEGMSILLFALGDGLITRIADDPSFNFEKHFGTFEKVIRAALQKSNNQTCDKQMGSEHEQG